MRVFALLALAARFAHAALPDCLPPDTKIVFGVSVRNLIDSPLLSGAFADAKLSATPFFKGTPLEGLDPFKDIDDLIVASTGEGEKAPTLLVLRGRFPPAIIPTGATNYHGVLLVDSKSPAGSFALLDSDTMIGGDLALVRAAIDRRGGTATIAPALLGRIESYDGRYDIWAVGDVPKGLQSSAASSPEMKAIDRFEFGASLRKGLEVVGEVHVRTSKDVEKLMQTIKLLELMMAMQPKGAASNGTKFDLTAHDNTIKLALFVPEEELKKASKQLMSTAVAAATGAAPQVTTPAPVLPPLPGSITRNEKGDTMTVTLPRK